MFKGISLEIAHFLTYKLGTGMGHPVSHGCPDDKSVSFLETWTQDKDTFLKFQLRPENEPDIEY